LIYSHGKGGVKKDKIKSAQWYRKAAEQGHARAQVSLGAAYESGEGVPKDYFEAVKWFQKSIEQDDDYGQYFLGIMYFNGHGVIRDRQKGCGLIRASAEQGYRDAIEAYNKVCAK
jgi:TPR repeat protein